MGTDAEEAGNDFEKTVRIKDIEQVDFAVIVGAALLRIRCGDGP